MSVGVVIGRFQVDELIEVYRDGELLTDWSFDEIRSRAI